MRADHHAGGWQYREHLRHTSRNHWLRDIEGRTRLFSSCPKGDPREDHNPQADNKRHDSDPNRVHTKIVGVRQALSDQRDKGMRPEAQAFGICSQFVNHPHHSV